MLCFGRLSVDHAGMELNIAYQNIYVNAGGRYCNFYLVHLKNIRADVYMLKICDQILVVSLH
jgi:hypothetical protein